MIFLSVSSCYSIQIFVFHIHKQSLISIVCIFPQYLPKKIRDKIWKQKKYFRQISAFLFNLSKGKECRNVDREAIVLIHLHRCFPLTISMRRASLPSLMHVTGKLLSWNTLVLCTELASPKTLDPLSSSQACLMRYRESRTEYLSIHPLRNSYMLYIIPRTWQKI